MKLVIALDCRENLLNKTEITKASYSHYDPWEEGQLPNYSSCSWSPIWWWNEDM